ncbi:MAG: 1-acyl-sn-glycerol-3-phosphate acyltransferase [Planctomycetaceae bacterium]|nr:1-acyl-sn-glycerol-3-phosphate acyltransferase [Planctomycetaceae bacterium]
MSPDLWGVLALSLYASVAIAALAWQCAHCHGGWGVWVLYLIARSYSPLMFRQRIRAKCPFPTEGAALVVANHRSPVDPMFIFSGSQEKLHGRFVRIVEFMTAREYCEVQGPIGWICRTMRCIPVDRNGKDSGPAKEALRRLQKGHLVGIFPEGRINLGDGLLPGNPGVAWLALRSRAPVLPVFIHDAPLGTSMVAPFITPSYTQVTFGDPIDLSDYYGAKPTPEVLAEVTDLLMERLGALGSVEARKCAPQRLSNGAALLAETG